MYSSCDWHASLQKTNSPSYFLFFYSQLNYIIYIEVLLLNDTRDVWLLYLT